MLAYLDYQFITPLWQLFRQYNSLYLVMLDFHVSFWLAKILHISRLGFVAVTRRGQNRQKTSFAVIDIKEINTVVFSARPSHLLSFIRSCDKRIGFSWNLADCVLSWGKIEESSHIFHRGAGLYARARVIWLSAIIAMSSKPRMCTLDFSLTVVEGILILSV